MKKEFSKKIAVGIFAGFFLLLTLACWFLPKKDFSESERRDLAKFPSVTVKTLLDGSFMSGFESYGTDRFPFRDGLRRIKALFSYDVFRKLDNNDIYMTDGYAVKLEYPENEASVKYAAQRFTYLYDRYLKDTGNRIFAAVVPDKGYYLAEKNGYLAMDYSKLEDDLQAGMDFAEFIPLADTLTEADYYRTDTHWRQEKLLKTAERLLTGMGGEAVRRQYKEVLLDQPFYGVYYGQAALPQPPEDISYLIWEGMENCIVTNGETNKPMDMYDMEKAHGKDPYQMYLGGSLSLLTVENPDAVSDRELIVFRDSFGSSIAPLLTEGYRKVTLIDTRYLLPDYLGNFVNFENADVLFLYSTLVLNNSETIK